MSRLLRRRGLALGGQRGFSLIELMIVIAVIGILSAIGLALYVNVERKGRIARAQWDVKMLASAVAAWSAHMGNIPTNAEGLAVLAVVSTNPQGQSAGPFLHRVPTPPGGGSPAWPGSYTYRADVGPGGTAMAGNFVVCGQGDGVVAHSVPGTASCP